MIYNSSYIHCEHSEELEIKLEQRQQNDNSPYYALQFRESLGITDAIIFLSPEQLDQLKKVLAKQHYAAEEMGEGVIPDIRRRLGEANNRG